MAKKLIIETEVKTDGLDKAAQKLGELKKLSQNISIQYDIDGKPLDVVIDKSLNLKRQVVELTKALRSVKEGSNEFRVLSSALGDTQDKLAASNAKSRDLLGSLQLIPGPVGQIASQLNGAISALKLFSGFSLKDIGFQFKELNNDLNDVIKNITGFGKAAVEAKDTTATGINTIGEKINTAAVAENTKEQILNSDAKLEDAKDTEINSLAVDKNTLANIENNIVKVQSIAESVKDRIAKLNAAVATGDLTAATLLQNEALLQEQLLTKLNTLETEKNILTSKISTSQTEIDTAAKTANTAATTGLIASLRAFFTSTLGIITVIAAAAYGIYKLVTAKRELTKQEKIAAEVNEKAIKDNGELISKLELLNEQVLQGGLTQREKNKAVNEYNEKLGETLGKVKTYDELEKKLRDSGPQYVAYMQLKAEADAAYALAVEQNKKLIEERLKVPTASAFDVWANGGVLGFFYEGFEGTAQNIKTRTLKELETGKNAFLNVYEDVNKKAQALAETLKLPVPTIKTDDKKPEVDKRIEATKNANALLLKLQQENAVNQLDTERKRQDEQLKIDKKNEEIEISRLFEIEGKKVKLTKEQEEIKGKLLEQIRVKYGLKVIDINKKRQDEDNKIFDEDVKKLKDYQNKVFEIINNADENELSRNKASRAKKFEDDKEALENDANFQKETLERKIAILLALEKGYKNDIQKLDDDEATKTRESASKKLEDQLKFLQIRGEALIEGTKQFYNNQRDILKVAQEKELKDLEDRAIKEKLTEQEIADAKLAIKEKYLKAAKDINKQELQDLLDAVSASIGVAQTITDDFGKILQLQQQNRTEDLNEEYIKQNELDKKNITNKEALERKLIENKKIFAKEEDKLKRQAFEENKKIQIAQAIMATLQSAIGAYSSLIATPFVGPVIAPIAAAAALFFGYKQVDLIKKTQYQSSLDMSNSETASAKPSGNANYGKNYAQGGLIGGRRHAEGGTLIEAEKGEAIMTRGAVTMFAPMLSMMNQMGGGTSFNSNLITTRQDKPIVSNPSQEQSPLVVKTYVVSSDLTTEAQKQGRLKDLSTL